MDDDTTVLDTSDAPIRYFNQYSDKPITTLDMYMYM